MSVLIFLPPLASTLKEEELLAREGRPLTALLSTLKGDGFKLNELITEAAISIFFNLLFSFLPSWSDFFRCCFFCICSGNTKTTTRGSDNGEDKWQWVCGWAVDMMLQHYHYLLNSFNHFWRHQRSTYLYVPAYVLKTCGHGPTLRRLTFCSLSL